MRVVVADPPAYTPPYDYALSAALVRQGLDVRLLTSRFRFGAVPPAAGFAVDDSLYGLSTRLRGRHGRLAAKALGHPRALAKLAIGPLRPPPSAVGVGAGERLLAPAHARAARLHGPRPAAAPHSAPHEHLEAPISALRPGRHAQRARAPQPRGVRRPDLEAPCDRTSRLSQRAGPRRRRAHRARARGDPAVQGPAGRDRGRARASRGAAPRRRRSADPAGRPAPRGRRPRRVASRLPQRAGDRARPRRRDGGRLPLQGRARPVRRAPAGDRSRRAGGRLRRRRPRRDRRRLRGRPGRAARGRRRA